jgi:aminoglycoside 6'-N-acetyltransferase I
MNLRNINETDLEECARLYAAVFSAEPWNEAWNRETALARLSHFYKSAGFIGVLAEQDGIIGFALGNSEPFCFGTLFYLREMCVHKAHQSQGIGSKVYLTLEKQLESSLVRGIYLATDRAIPAAQFYVGKGFGCSESMGFYSKQLSHNQAKHGDR